MITTRTEHQAMMEVSRRHHDGLRFHDLRHSATAWPVDDEAPPNTHHRCVDHGRHDEGPGLCLV